jgi:hypothetical protein
MKLEDKFKFSPAEDIDIEDDEYVLKADSDYRVQVSYERGDTFYTPSKIVHTPDYGVIFYDTVENMMGAMMDIYLLSQKDAA